MVIVVFDSLGYCRIGNSSIDRSPINRISRLTTSASTGRRIKISVKDDIVSVERRGAWPGRESLADLDLGAVLNFDLPSGNDPLAWFDPVEDSHLVAPSGTSLDRSADDLENRVSAGVLALFADHINAVTI